MKLNSSSVNNWCHFIIFICFPIISLSFLSSDLWFDELVTLNDFARKENLRDIFLSYPVANNHILFSFVLWIWLQLTDHNVFELIIRFLNLIIAISGLLFIYHNTRKLFDELQAFFIVLILVFSPLYLNFAFQLRGYGLTIFLSALATIGSLYIIEGKTQKGSIYFIIGTVLLPCVMPVNILLNISLILFMHWTLLNLQRSRRHRNLLLILSFASIAGFGIYIPIFDQFINVLKHTEGWNSSFRISTHVLFSLLVHSGLFIFFSYLIAKGANHRPKEKIVCQTIAKHLPLLLFISGVVCFIFIVCAKPFPRTFIAFLVPITICSFTFYDRNQYCKKSMIYIAILVIICNSGFWFHFTDFLKKKHLNAGSFSQDLLTQYYNRNSDISDAIIQFNDTLILTGNSRLFVDFHLFPTLHHYWSLAEKDPGQIECLNGGNKIPLKLPKRFYYNSDQYILGYDQKFSQDSYKHLVNAHSKLEKLNLNTDISLFKATKYK